MGVFTRKESGESRDGDGKIEAEVTVMCGLEPRNAGSL